MNKSHSKKNSGIKLLLICFFLLFVLLPLLNMFRSMLSGNTMNIFATTQFQDAMKHSLTVSSITTLLVTCVAFPFASFLAKRNGRGKNLFVLIAALPMLIPSISHGMGLVFLLGTNGMLTNLFGPIFQLYGKNGIVLASSVYAFPVAFLMFYDILRYEDGTTYEAADILGIPKWRQFFSITLPFLAKPLVSILFSVFTMVITDYGVPLILGGQYTTLPVLMYNEVIGLLHFDTGSMIGSVLLLPAIIAFLIDLFMQKEQSEGFVQKRITSSVHPFKKLVSWAYIALISLFLTAPILSFIPLTFVKKYPVDLSFSTYNIEKSFTMGAGINWAHSIFVALLVALLGTILCYISAYFTTRSKGKLSRILYLFSILSMSIPGIVLGLSYVISFKATPIYRTFLILVIVGIVHFFSSPYLMAHNSLLKLNPDLEDVGLTLGIPRWRIVLRVIVPQSLNTILEMISYFFVNAMITISAVSFLATTSTMPLALMITQFESQMLIECSAFVSLIILLTNIVLKSIIYFIQKITERRLVNIES